MLAQELFPLYETSLPRVFYRGTKLESKKRIRTGEPDWDRWLFVSSNRDAALMYGDQIAIYHAKPEAKILYQGSRAFRSLAKGLFKPTRYLLPDLAETMRRAEADGYDAVWFRMQGDVGTAIIHPEAFTVS